MPHSHSSMRLALLLVITISAHAGGHKAKVLEVQEPPKKFDVKGVALGSSVDDLKTKVPDLKCLENSKPGNDGIDKWCNRSEQKCDWIGNKQFCHDKQILDSFAGHQALIQYNLHDGKIWGITITGIEPTAFDDVEQTMETKYGKPTAMAHKDIQNRMGAHFTNGTAIWGSAPEDDRIVYEKYRERLDAYSKLDFYSSEAWAVREQAVKSQTEARKSDM